MRVFRFLRSAATRPPLALTLLLGAAGPSTALAQWPAELDVRVRDASSGAAVSGARVRVVGSPIQGSTTAQGVSLLEGIAEGRGELHVDAFGYEDATVGYVARNGLRTIVRVAIEPDALELEGITASGGRGTRARSGTIRLTAETIRNSTAETVGEALSSLPGVLVRRDAPGAAERVSVRGSPTDAVLVLVDGVPINDALTGEADLSQVALTAVGEIVLHRGAASALFGPRARAGAVEISTSAPRDDVRVDLGAGSLGFGRMGFVAGRRIAGLTVSGGTEVSRLGGRFPYRLPQAAGGGRHRRSNADLLRTNAWAGADMSRGPVRASIRFSGDRTERGLPGIGYGPTEHARQRDWGGQLVGAVSSESAPASWGASIHGSVRERRFQDPAPPAGLPYDERARVIDAGSRIRGSFEAGFLGLFDGGVQVGTVMVDASSLDERTPGSVLNAGAHLGLSRSFASQRMQLGSRVRLDRDGWITGWHVTHAVSLSVMAAGLQVDLSHRSAFSPPTLADQFFSEGFAVRPNPDLRGERIPAEMELSGRYAPGRLGVGASVFNGDVTDLIVWQPDFRFVWSPTNTDVRRSGGEAWMQLQGRNLPLSAQASFTHTRLRYDRAGPVDTVQVAYRPRNVGALGAAWAGPRWGLTLDGRYVGERFPVPSPINALPGFWAWDARARHRSSWRGWNVETRVGVHRMFNQTATLVFGFPDPGRTLSLDISLMPGNPPARSSKGS